MTLALRAIYEEGKLRSLELPDHTVVGLSLETTAGTMRSEGGGLEL